MGARQVHAQETSTQGQSSRTRRKVASAITAALLLVACSSSTQPSLNRPEEPVAPTGTPEPGAELGGLTDGLARFVVKTREGEAAGLQADLTERFGPTAQARRLFAEVDAESDPDGMARMFRVVVPTSALPSEHEFDNAFWLKEQLGLEEAEPDMETALDATLEMTAVCLADVEPPTDKAWSLAAIHAPQAWELRPTGRGKRFGEGVTVCHPDTGWAEHVDLDSSRIDLSRARNLLKDGTADGRDPLDGDAPFLNPGHGVGTGSVIVSGHRDGEVLGVAPRATLVPIRTARSVIQVFDSDLARAVNYAVDAKCDVISMSLGGRGFFGLKAAIRRAVRHQLIVTAAAGNCVRFVVNPAAYPDTLAVGGTNVESKPWRGSSRGAAVDISAPAEHVWIANRRKAADPTSGSAAGQGTSYAVANVAGSAALWLAFHGRENLLDRYSGSVTLQQVFRHLVRATARAPESWNAGSFGAGILDVEALLSRALPPAATLETLVTESEPGELALLSAVVGRPPRDLGPLLARLFGVELVEVEDRLREHGPELVALALSDPDGFDRLLESLADPDAGTLESAPVSDVIARGSDRLRSSVVR